MTISKNRGQRKVAVVEAFSGGENIIRSPRCGLYECVHFTRVYREHNESFSVGLVSAIFETARAARGLRNRHTHERTHARTNAHMHSQYGNHGIIKQVLR